MKVWNYIIITTGMMLILVLAGFHIGAVDNLLNTLHLTTTNQDIGSSGLYNWIYTYVFLAVAIGGIVVGFFTQAKTENYIILPLIAAQLVAWLSCLVGIMSYANSNYNGFISFIIIAILGPLTVGYLISLVEFFRGTD